MLSFGFDGTTLQAVLDTTTHSTFVAAEECTDCEGAKYNVVPDVLGGAPGTNQLLTRRTMEARLSKSTTSARQCAVRAAASLTNK